MAEKGKAGSVLPILSFGNDYWHKPSTKTKPVLFWGEQRNQSNTLGVKQ